MTYLFLSFVLVAMTATIIRPAFVSDPRLPVAGNDGRAVLAVFPFFLVATLVIGLDFALAAMFAFAVKEFGHVIGYRFAGHADATFRLIPVPGGPAASSSPPQSDLAALFILLMGPGLGLAPMVAAIAVAQSFASSAPDIAQAARLYALTAGAVNFIALLPLHPLPGGRLTQMIVEARLPRISGLAGAALVAFALGMSLTLHSMLLFLLALVGLLAVAQRRPRPDRPRLTRAQVRIGFFAYFTTLAAYFLSGSWVLTLVPLGF